MFFYNLSFLFTFFFSMISFLMFLFFIFNDLTYFIEWEILNLNSCEIIMTFLFDWMSFLFMSFVLFISSLVMFYSKEYMMEDKNSSRFIILIILFVFSMMMLIISPNLISILLGWDGLGLVSYCLVIYFQNIKSYNAGMITALSNRIGDVMLLISIAWMLNFGSWSYYFYIDIYKKELNMQIIGVLVVIAAMTKSAQIPFSSWLPAAMAAPTPVSALVHSSTLVTAGVYLLIRFNELINFFFISKFLLFISILTMFMSGIGANFEIDLKKVIALSTLSQLGLMMSILCLKFYKLAFFHLLSHALFKALLFLCAGAFIHNMMNFQDVRLSGNFFNQMPLTSVCFNISSLALCGMPFLTGFYSKDLILESVCLSKLNFFLFFLFFFSTMLTVSYSFRLIFFISVMSFSGFSLMSLSDENWLMLKMILILSVLSIFGGSMVSWLIFPYFSLIILPFYLKFLTMIVCMIGVVAGYFIFSILKFYKLSYKMLFLKMYFSMMWYLPFLSTLNFIFFFLNISKKYLKSIDFGWNEMFGGAFLMKLFYNFTLFYQKIQFNQLKIFFFSYLVMMMFFMMIFFL